MRKELHSSIFVAMLSFAAFATVAQAQSLHSVLDQSRDLTLEDFEETGKTRRCLNFKKLERLKAITEKELLFVEQGELYRNVPFSACTGAMDPNNRYNFSSSGGRICKGSNLVIISRSSWEVVGGCSLGDFKLLKLRQDIDTSKVDDE